jgi:hypothetical protein
MRSVQSALVPLLPLGQWTVSEEQDGLEAPVYHYLGPTLLPDSLSPLLYALDVEQYTEEQITFLQRELGRTLLVLLQLCGVASQHLFAHQYNNQLLFYPVVSTEDSVEGQLLGAAPDLNWLLGTVADPTVIALGAADWDDEVLPEPGLVDIEWPDADLPEVPSSGLEPEVVDIEWPDADLPEVPSSGLEPEVVDELAPRPIDEGPVTTAQVRATLGETPREIAREELPDELAPANLVPAPRRLPWSGMYGAEVNPAPPEYRSVYLRRLPLLDISRYIVSGSSEQGPDEPLTVLGTWRGAADPLIWAALQGDLPGSEYLVDDPYGLPVPLFKVRLGGGGDSTSGPVFDDQWADGTGTQLLVNDRLTALRSGGLASLPQEVALAEPALLNAGLLLQTSLYHYYLAGVPQEAVNQGIISSLPPWRLLTGTWQSTIPRAQLQRLLAGYRAQVHGDLSVTVEAAYTAEIRQLLATAGLLTSR